MKPIVLMTDFGLEDPFVGIMKGVIARISPDARILDLTHAVRAQDVAGGAFALFRSAPYFPKGSIFCAVVDPGVGSARRALAIQTRDYLFVGPDNGLLWPAAAENGVDACVSLTNSDYFLERPSATFHGRDMFAPVSAHLAQGTAIRDLGPQIHDPVRFTFPVPEEGEGRIRLTVLDTDIFGNLTLNIGVEDFMRRCPKGFSLRYKTHVIDCRFSAYAQAPENRPFVLAGSSGFMEVAVKNGSARARLGAEPGEKFVLVPL